MGKFKMIILWLFAALTVLVAGCEEEKMVTVELTKQQSIDEAQQTDEVDVDPYWAQPVDSGLCRTVGECRDLGDTYGIDHFEAFRRGLSYTDEPWLLDTGTESDKFGYDIGHEDEESVLAHYEIKDDELVLTSGVEEGIFNDVAEVVLALYDRSKIDFRELNFQKDVYSHVMVYDGKLGILANDLTQMYQPFIIATLLHEYGHMLTLRLADQTVNENCPDGCFKDESYYSLYYYEFLTEYEKEWLTGGYERPEDRMAFYEKHKDAFVSTYAAVNSYEDIAESFTRFILMPYNENPQSVPENKINFFYQFPELVEYRTFVLKTLNERKKETGGFY